MKVTHYLHKDSIDYAKRIAMFSYRTDGCEDWVTLQVTLSGLLINRMLNMGKERQLNAGVSYDNTEFVSELSSPNYNDSPFKLKMWTPGEGSNIPLNATLECVDQDVKSIRDLITKKILGYEKVIGNAANWMRYEVVQSTLMLSDLKYKPAALKWKVRKTRPY